MAAVYDNPFRPIYEGYAALVWAATAVAALIVGELVDLPAGPFLYVAAACLAMGFARAWPAAGLWAKRRHLAGRRQRFMRARALRGRMRRDKVWLGWGFEWTPAHTQLAHDVLRQDTSAYLRSDPAQPGAQWLHGLERRDHDVHVPIKYLEGHTLIVGTTGTGKTRLLDLLVMQAVLRREAVIIIDPKGDKDLRAQAEGACRLARRPEAFVYFHPAFPERSVRLDPLRNWNRSTELANRVAALIPSETGADPFKAFGQMVLDNVVQGLLATDERPNLARLRRHIEGGPEHLLVGALQRHFDRCVRDWEARAQVQLRRLRTDSAAEKARALVQFYREQVRDSYPSRALDGLISQFEHERDHFTKMVASLMPVLNMLTSGDLGPLLSPDPSDAADTRPITDVARIIKDAQVAYIGLDSLADGMVGSAIGSILLADLTAAAGDRYNYGIDNRRVHVFVDEAAEAVNDPFIQLLNKGRGAGILVTLASQTFADFAARVGSEAKARQVLGNVNNLVALRVLDAETQQYIADGLPRTRVKTLVHGHGESTLASAPLLFSGNYGERLQEEESALVPAEIFGLLPNLHYLARLSGGRIVKGRLPILVHGS
jgi:conjugal transfer pilus assembly protein TraD